MIDRILSEQRNGLVHATEIQWQPDAVPRLELTPLTPLVALDHAALLAYVLGLQDELAAVRTVLHATLGALALANAQRERLRQRVRQLVDALRTVRETRTD